MKEGSIVGYQLQTNEDIKGEIDNPIHIKDFEQ